ncbi:hypothetical protein BDV41DRAFT_536653 [Aspergillus transmontanensis]|uniref:Uncharacterized protein n=1 Tax=Aspergillus transmontanensis TaxID=1034304 RepID=A0A5N6VY30_9EURO|nr:hypothetical protein BDV41DRAFT_536653 [Aspergillus transmontanensis]
MLIVPICLNLFPNLQPTAHALTGHIRYNFLPECVSNDPPSCGNGLALSFRSCTKRQTIKELTRGRCGKILGA